MRFIILLVIIYGITGCASIGDYEIMNKHPTTKKIGEISRVYSKILVRTHNYPANHFSAQKTNTFYGQLKETSNTYRKGVPFNKIPNILRDIQLLESYGK